MTNSVSGCICGTIVDRYCLNRLPAQRQTWHISVDLNGRHLPFRPGDCVGIWPKNPDHAVKGVIDYLRLDPATLITNPRTQQALPLKTYLEEAVDLHVVSHRLAELVSTTALSHEDRRGILEALMMHKGLEGFEVLDFLHTFAPHGVEFAAIAPGLTPTLPRLYSISSGPTQSTTRIDLTVARVQYECLGRNRLGLCSNFLITAPVDAPIRLFHHASQRFSFPADSTDPLIMISAGTGVAPFRSYMQEVEIGSIPLPRCWLFFGEQKSTRDFFYEEFWKSQVCAGRLRLDLAFSQDQEQKIYVQHRMWDHRAELWRWLNEGAVVLVCGNAKKMAKDVDDCLVNIAICEGGFSQEKALQFLRDLRRQGRYRRDVY